MSCSGQRSESGESLQDTDSFMKSAIACIPRDSVERDGLRHHFVEVGSSASEQTPGRLSLQLIKPSGAIVSVMQT